MRYLWAAYRMGDFDKLGFTFSRESDKQGFIDEFQNFLLGNYHAGWVIAAPTNKGVIPVGMVFAQFTGPMLLVGDFTWFSWASNRNIMEGTAHFFRHLRNDAVAIMYFPTKEQRFYDYMARLGVIRRIGNIHDVLDGPAMMYQTRREQWRIS